MDLRKAFTVIALCLSLAGQSAAATIKGRIFSERIENLENFVVFIKQADSRFFTAPKEPVRSFQRDYHFIPRVLPIVRGTSVVFTSHDSGTHNIHTFKNEPIFFDFSILQDSEYGPIRFNDEGEVMLLCNMHAQMKGFILVLQNPYFSKTGREGSFTIQNVPPGKYELMTWHEEYKSFSQEIVIKSFDEITKAHFRY